MPRSPRLPSVLLAAFLAVSFAVGPGWTTAALAAPPKKAASGMASITVTSLTRGAKVYVDDQEVGEVPLPGPLEVKPGTHTIRVQKRGYAPFTDTVVTAAGQDSEVEADLVPTGGIVKITSNVVRAQVMVNGKVLGRTPFDGDVEPGSHTLQVAAAGYLADERKIEVRAGEELKVDVQLKLVPAPVVQEDKSIFGRWWFWGAVGTVVVGGVTAGVLASQDTHVRPPAYNGVINLP